MSELKHVFEARMAHWAELQAKILAAPGLTETEQEQVEEVLTEYLANQRQAWIAERADEAIDYLFPVWHRQGQSASASPHPQWHEKSWWWNGASIKSLDVLSNGDLKVSISSYVGGGDCETVKDLILKKEWIDADDMGAVIKAYCQNLAHARQVAEHTRELARAQQAAVDAAERLARLAGKEV